MAINQTMPSGRSVHLKQAHALSGALDRVDDRSGRAVEIAGDPGSGKTRLAADLAREATRRGFSVLIGRCTEDEKDIPLHPFARMLVSRLGRAHRERRCALTTTDVFDLLQELTQDRTLLVLDDFHFADEKSAELVDRLIRLAIPNLLLVLVHRPRQTRRWMVALAYAHEVGLADRVLVQPLNLRQSAEIAGLPVHDPRLHTLHERSDGNPSYLLALTSPDNTPPTALLGELVLLTPEQRSIVNAAAVLGDQFDIMSVASVAETCQEVVRVLGTRLADRDLFRMTDATATHYAFRHPVVREIIYRNIDLSWRAAAHHRALKVLLDGQVPFEDLRVHVEALLENPNLERHRLIIRVAGQASVAEPSIVAAWLRRIVAVWPADEAYRDERLDLSLKLAAALAASGQVAESSALYRNTLPELPALRPEARTAAVIRCVQLECVLGYFEEATNLVDSELARLPAGNHNQRLELRLARQFITMTSGGLASVARTERTLELARRHGNRVNHAGALAAAGFQRLFAGDVRGAAAAVTSCAAIVDMLSDAELGQHSEYLSMLAWTEYYMDRFTVARRHFTRGAALVRRAGTLHQVPTMLLGVSITAQQVGQFGETASAAAEASRLAGEMGADQLLSLTLAVESTCALAVDRGAGRALALAEKALVSLPRHSAFGQPDVATALASAALADGDALRCTASLLGLGGAGLDTVPLIQRAICYDLLAEAAVALGDVANARRWASSATSIAERTGLLSHYGYALSAQGHLLRAEGDAPAAMSLYAGAAGQFAEAGMVAAQIRMLVAAAGSASASGEAMLDGDLSLALARELARRHEAWGDFERARVARPEPPSQRATGADESLTSMLTSREMEIAKLAAKGDRTKEIATRLFLSPRTVETHLSRIYRKMRVKSRAALASALRLDSVENGPAEDE